MKDVKILILITTLLIMLLTCSSFAAGKTYLECSFAYEGGPYKEGQNWQSGGVASYPCEVGYFTAADYSGNVANGGSIRLAKDPTDSSRLCLELENTWPGTRPLSSSQHTKLWDASDTRWAAEDKVEEAYYCGEVYIPKQYVDGSNIMQWGHWAPTHGSMPEAKIIFNDDQHLYFSNKVKEHPKTHDLGWIPLNQWVSVCVYIKSSSTYYATDGVAKIWVNDEFKYEDLNFQGRSKTADHYMFVWSINNYASPSEPQGTKLYWRNVKVTSEYQTGPIPPPDSQTEDINQDGVVNVLDLIRIGQRIGQTGSAGWIREDINKDGTINILDMILVAQHQS